MKFKDWYQQKDIPKQDVYKFCYDAWMEGQKAVLDIVDGYLTCEEIQELMQTISHEGINDRIDINPTLLRGSKVNTHA